MYDILTAMYFVSVSPRNLLGKETFPWLLQHGYIFRSYSILRGFEMNVLLCGYSLFLRTVRMYSQ